MSDMSGDETAKVGRRTRGGSRAPSEGPQPVTRSTRRTTPAPSAPTTRGRTTPTPAGPRAGAARRGAKAKPFEDINESDPLDVIGDNSAELDEPAPQTKARRGVRGKPKVKEEEDDNGALDQIDEEDETERAPRAPRGRKAAPVQKATGATANSKTITTRTQSRTGRKVPSVEPSAPRVFEKENTPDHPDAETSTATKAVGVAKTAARAKGGRAAAKPASRTRAGTVTEDEDSPADTARTRAGRVRAGAVRK